MRSEGLGGGSAEDPWQDLLSVAAVGSTRRPLVLPSVPGPFGSLLQRLQEMAPESRLLAAAAAVSLRARAGCVLPVDPEPSEAPAAPDPQPVCSPQAEAQLRRILGGGHAKLLPQWIHAAVARGVRLPETLLPQLMELGRTDPRLSGLVAQVAGVRGRWLATQNPDWLAFREAPDPAAQLQTWQTGTRAERLGLLRRLRGEAGLAGRALALLQSTWREESAPDRSLFLEVLEAGLGPADEPFLEAALEDRRKAVHRAAARLLASLRGSALCARMTERLRPLLARDGDRLRVGLPPSCDGAMIRDGIEPKPRPGAGEKSWWLLQMLSIVPPSECAALLASSAGALVTLAKRSEWEIVLLEGWMLAARRHRDADWAEALLESAPRSAGEFDRDELLEVLPPERREALVLRALAASPEPLLGGQTAFALLQRCTHPWSEPFSAAVLSALRAHVARPPSVLRLPLRACLAGFGLSVAPGLELPSASDGPWAEPLHQMAVLLELRGDMLRDFAS